MSVFLRMMLMSSGDFHSRFPCDKMAKSLRRSSVKVSRVRQRRQQCIINFTVLNNVSMILFSLKNFRNGATSTLNPHFCQENRGER